MPFNGAGLFTQIYNWVTDKANFVKITASRFELTYEDMAAAFSNCVTRDGQSPPTANIPMGAMRIINLADGIAATDAATVGQVAILAGGAVFYSAGNSGVAMAIDWSLGQHQVFTLTNNATITLGNGVNVGWHTLVVLQDATGGRSITWAGAGYSAAQWMGNAAAPQLSPVGSAVEFLTLFWDGGSWSMKRMYTHNRRWNYQVVAKSLGQIVGASATASLAFADELTDPYGEFNTPDFTAKLSGLYRMDVQVFCQSGTSSDGAVTLTALMGANTQVVTNYIQVPLNQMFNLSVSIVGTMAPGDIARCSTTNGMPGAFIVQAASSITITRLGDAE